MGTIALGNVIASAAPDEFILLVARIEGAGFLGIAVAIPRLLAGIVIRKARDFVMAAWSAYMPTGIMLMLLAAPLLTTIGWRNFWLANALVTGTCAILLAIHAPMLPADERGSATRLWSDIRSVIHHPVCLLLALAFFAYSCQIFSLTFALPLLLTSEYGMPLGGAGLLSAFVLAVSAIGHFSSGLLLRAGVPIWANIAAAFGLFAFSGFAIYDAALAPSSIALFAALALGIGGLAPGAMYAAAPHAAPTPSAVPPTIGLVHKPATSASSPAPLHLVCGSRRSAGIARR